MPPTFSPEGLDSGADAYGRLQRLAQDVLRARNLELARAFDEHAFRHAALDDEGEPLAPDLPCQVSVRGRCFA